MIKPIKKFTKVKFRDDDEIKEGIIEKIYPKYKGLRDDIIVGYTYSIIIYERDSYPEPHYVDEKNVLI